MGLPDQSVDLDSLDIVKLLDGILDLTLVRLDVNDEDEGVVLLDLLHGRLGVQRVNDGAVSIHTGEREDSLALVLGLAGESKGLGSDHSFMVFVLNRERREFCERGGARNSASWERN